MRGNAARISEYVMKPRARPRFVSSPIFCWISAAACFGVSFFFGAEDGAAGFAVGRPFPCGRFSPAERFTGVLADFFCFFIFRNTRLHCRAGYRGEWGLEFYSGMNTPVARSHGLADLLGDNTEFGEERAETFGLAFLLCLIDIACEDAHPIARPFALKLCHTNKELALPVSRALHPF